MTKSELRQIYLTLQKTLSPEQRAEQSRRIALHLFESLDLSKIKLLHCFIPIEKFNEVDTTPIFRSLRSTVPNIQFACPRVNFESGEMESIAYADDTQLVENVWGIREPVGKPIEPERIDIILVPGLAFDRTGHRVGYGKGFYDRFLKRCRPDCVKLGLSYFEPLDEIVDVHEGDSSLDACITPEGIFTAEMRRKEDLATDRHG